MEGDTEKLDRYSKKIRAHRLVGSNLFDTFFTSEEDTFARK